MIHSLKARMQRDRKAIEYHYDVSNEFYELFLGPTMVYTCAYYRRPDGDLDQAQTDKLDLVCRKLRLAPGERLLDVGCGWGSLVRHAATHYGVDATGVTLSPSQATYADQRIRAEGLEASCRVECRDYRELADDRYDKIAAVGIIEHVGIRNYASYFRRMRELLKPGGLFLNHGITHESGWRETPQWLFIVKHVFPNGELDHVSHILSVAEDEGWEIRDVEQLREHYSRTCRQWAANLARRKREALRLVSEETYRIWLLYLTGSARYFAEGSIGLYQAVLENRADALREVPTTREAIYRERPSETLRFASAKDRSGSAPAFAVEP